MIAFTGYNFNPVDFKVVTDFSEYSWSMRFYDEFSLRIMVLYFATPNLADNGLEGKVT